jgi:hypothetical protein
LCVAGVGFVARQDNTIICSSILIYIRRKELRQNVKLSVKYDAFVISDENEAIFWKFY